MYTSMDDEEDALPKCLWEWKPSKDLGDGPFHREDCLDESQEKSLQGEMKLCECPVLRKGSRVLESFQALECL